MKSHRVTTDYRSVECASGRRRDTARGGAHAEHTEERVAASSCVYCTRNNTRGVLRGVRVGCCEGGWSRLYSAASEE